MRPLSEWNESDLQRLIADDVQESLTLDYKRSDSLSKSDDKKKIEITKDVSAFANSAGGRIIYGIIEQGHHPTEIDAGSDPKVITREWLEQVVNGIQPRIHGVVIKPIPLANGNNAFVVDIPMAQAGGPHQATDQRYYRRFNFQSVPMYHHEIMDVANRAASPLIEVEWDFVRGGAAGDVYEALFLLSLHNRSKQPAMYGSCTIFIDEEAVPDRSGLDPAQWTADRDVKISMPGGTHQFRVVQRKFAVPADQPIYLEQGVSLGRLGLQLRPHAQFMMGWRFVCPGYSRLQWGVLELQANQRIRTHWFSPET